MSRLRFFFAQSIFIICFLLLGLFFNVQADTIDCSYGGNPAGCSYCTCSNAHQDLAPHCGNVRFGSITCYDSQNFQISGPSYGNCAPYPDACGQFMCQDFAQCSNQGYTVTGVDHTDWSYITCSDNQNKQCSFGSGPPPQVSPLPIIVGQKVLMPGNQQAGPQATQTVYTTIATPPGTGHVNSTTNNYRNANPFYGFVYQDGTSVYNVAVSPMPGYNIGYTLCYGTSACHTTDPITPGASVNVQSSQMERLGSANLFFHYSPVNLPTSTPVPPTPTPTVVIPPGRVSIRVGNNNCSQGVLFSRNLLLLNGTTNVGTDYPGVTLQSGQTYTTTFTYACTPDQWFNIQVNYHNPPSAPVTTYTDSGVQCGSFEFFNVSCPTPTPTAVPPTPTFIQCPAMTPPTNLQPNGAVYPAGNYNLTWSAVPNATNYAIRIDDQQNGWKCDDYDPNDPSTWWPACCNTPYAGDVCSTLPNTTSYTFGLQSGHNYYWWTNSINYQANQCNVWSTDSVHQSMYVPLPTQTPNQPPTGSHDDITCSLTRGSACDPSNYNAQVSVDIYLDGPAGTGTYLATVPANQVYTGSSQACITGANHGWSYTIQSVAGKHTYYAYAHGVNPSNVALLPNSPQTVSCLTTQPTNTPIPTATPAPWAKVKNGSFQKNGTLSYTLPVAPTPYDADDPGHSFFIDQAASKGGVPGFSSPTLIDGVVSATNMSIPLSNLSFTHWSVASTPLTGWTINSYLEYIQSRKAYTTITDVSQITKDGIYILNAKSPVTLTSGSIKNKVVLIYQGTIVLSGGIVIPQVFSPASPVAIFANTIEFANTLTEADGIFYGNNVVIDAQSNLGLKVVGNVISQAALQNGRDFNSSSNSKPSLFVVFDPSKYVSLLQYMSSSTYDWTELQ